MLLDVGCITYIHIWLKRGVAIAHTPDPPSYCSSSAAPALGGAWRLEKQILSYLTKVNEAERRTKIMMTFSKIMNIRLSTRAPCIPTWC